MWRLLRFFKGRVASVVVRRFLALALAWASALAFAQSIEVRRLEELRKTLGVDKYDSVSGVKDRLRTLKVAVLDKGFGQTFTLDQELPPSIFKLTSTYDAAFLEKHKLGKPSDQNALDENDDHGRAMALALWAVTGNSSIDAPQILLLNSNGLTNFGRAVQYCIDEKVDIVLFSQNWEYGGNFDGKGFINKIVSSATDAGILWVNAAGNYGRRVHNATVSVGADQWVRLGAQGAGLRVKSRLDRNPFKAVLSWNQYTDEETSGTEKDLDLYVFDEAGKEIMKADLKQVVKKEGVERATGESYVPREIVEGRVSRGTYFIKVKAKGGTFDSFDRVRITLLSQSAPYFDSNVGSSVDPLEFLDATEGGEIMIPADHPKVIAVGDKSQISALGPTADGRSKPDLVLASSSIEFTDGMGSSGTSNAAALFAGVLAMLKAHQPGLTTADVLRFTQAERVSAAKLTSERAGITDLGLDTFKQMQGGVYQALEGILGKGAVQLAGRRQNGSYIVALGRSPLDLGKYFKNLPPVNTDPSNWEMYLVQVTDSDGKDRVRAFWRNPRRGPAQAQAWEKILKQNPERFVRIVRANQVQDASLPVLSLWKTPEPSSLLTLP